MANIPNRLAEPFSGIGSTVERALAYLGGIAQLLGRALAHAFISPLKRNLSVQRACHQAMAVGVEALPVISFITFFIGVIMALQGAYELRRFGALHLVADTVAISITRELGPLVTAIVVIGRSGSAFAAEIGTMKVTEELDALETMALHPIAFLVTPKLLAMLVMMPCLTIWADLMGVYSVEASLVSPAPITRSELTSLLRATRSTCATSLPASSRVSYSVSSLRAWVVRKDSRLEPDRRKSDGRQHQLS